MCRVLRGTHHPEGPLLRRHCSARRSARCQAKNCGRQHRLRRLCGTLVWESAQFDLVQLEELRLVRLQRRGGRRVYVRLRDALAHELVRLRQPPLLAPHEVAHCRRGRARAPRHAVHQHALASLAPSLDRGVELGEGEARRGGRLVLERVAVQVVARWHLCVRVCVCGQPGQGATEAQASGKWLGMSRQLSRGVSGKGKRQQPAWQLAVPRRGAGGSHGGVYRWGGVRGEGRPVLASASSLATSRCLPRAHAPTRALPHWQPRGATRVCLRRVHSRG